MNRRIFTALLLTAGLAAAAELPRQSPAYTFRTPDGRQVKLADYKGKVVVLEFLLVTCPHCQTTARVLSKLQNEFGGRGFQALGVSIDPAADVRNFIQMTGANFPVGVSPDRESVYAYLQHSLMSSTFYVPQLVIIDRNGVIREQHGGTDPYLLNEEPNLRRSLEPLLNERVGAAKKPASRKATKKSS